MKTPAVVIMARRGAAKGGILRRNLTRSHTIGAAATEADERKAPPDLQAGLGVTREEEIAAKGAGLVAGHGMGAVGLVGGYLGPLQVGRQGGARILACRRTTC